MARKPNRNELNLRISARQDAVAACLASGRTIAATARECRVSTVTIWEWKKQEAFRARVAELRELLIDRAVGRLAEMMAGKAAETLEKLLLAKSDHIRLESVRTIFETFIDVKNAAELKARIEALEQST
jgi:hypothetical protein